MSRLDVLVHKITVILKKDDNAPAGHEPVKAIRSVPRSTRIRCGKLTKAVPRQTPNTNTTQNKGGLRDFMGASEAVKRLFFE